MNAKIKYILQRTFHEFCISLYGFFDKISPDFTLFSPFRKVILSLFTQVKIGKKTRIRKWLYLTNIKKLRIWKNCFINRENTFDNNALITIWDDCSIWYGNKFLTSSHYEKQNVNIKKLEFTTYSKEIQIGNNVWITSGCIILPWSIIEDDVIVASGAVVSWKLESWFVYGWIPAKKIRETQGFISKKM